MLSSEKRRDPLACIDPPLTVRLAFSEGQKQGEVSFREGQEAPAPRKTADFDTVYSQAGGQLQG